MNQFFTSLKSSDGFGAQYQRILQTYIYCKMHNLNFVYDKFSYIEHNYDNDINLNDKLENLINLKDNIINANANMTIKHLDYGTIVMPFFENNIDLCCNSEDMKFIKECFWKNKSKATNFYNNNKINVAVHIRRENSHDKGLSGERASTPNSYYSHIMNHIREKYKDNELLFHIYSQGSINDFKDLISDDVKFYINYDAIESFIGMVSANVLVISPSSFN
jgi:hypothetical protein